MIPNEPLNESLEKLTGAIIESYQAEERTRRIGDQALPSRPATVS
ncbi:MAG TPA: hypothetical protein VM098_06755 [Phycisphaerae bacterium]|nr:hypothetical protein [Phycisphaerae bacterium]